MADLCIDYTDHPRTLCGRMNPLIVCKEGYMTLPDVVEWYCQVFDFMSKTIRPASDYKRDIVAVDRETGLRYNVTGAWPNICSIIDPSFELVYDKAVLIREDV